MQLSARSTIFLLAIQGNPPLSFLLPYFTLFLTYFALMFYILLQFWVLQNKKLWMAPCLLTASPRERLQSVCPWCSYKHFILRPPHPTLHTQSFCSCCSSWLLVTMQLCSHYFLGWDTAPWCHPVTNGSSSTWDSAGSVASPAPARPGDVSWFEKLRITWPHFHIIHS